MTIDAHLIETELQTEQVFSGGFLQVHLARVALPNGAESFREFITHPGAVVILAFLPSGDLLFERQFRYPLRRVFLELPAGKIDAGEDPLQTAQRELREETGYTAARWQYLGVMHPCISYSDERIEIFAAYDLVRDGEQKLDANEFLEITQLSPEAATAAVFSGQITDAKTISALFWLPRCQSLA